MRLGLFPLPLFLLPGGVTKLRIFEPRYVRLVKEAMHSGNGFVLSMKDGDAICRFGTLVDIIDFEQLPDGLLGITIRGKSRAKIFNVAQEDDKLWVGDVEALGDWPADFESLPDRVTNALKSIFDQHPQHAAQYDDEPADFSDSVWVCQRWLEVLPLENSQKQWFISQDNAEEAKSFIIHLLSD
ncbi:LON peptidase substrate-binding domain-containing protein [Veronia pacifica]|uniref:ATP-dependent protease n=1 Tax=Veronia pacifica TaxID=1080227 RepID=A0A1C3EPU4_9GAMM|nr:LON peptidase substrate-binding domain-containing protein [Veronia pacifica]ODA35263.1 ATP-dependent protease [Veronia pacifica]